MPQGQGQIIGSGVNPTGQHYMLDVTSEGAIPISGTININNISGSITIGSVSANVDSIFVQSGTMFISSGTNLTGSFAITTNPIPVSGEVSVAGDLIPFDYGYIFMNYTGSNVTAVSYFNSSGGTLLGSLGISYDAGDSIIAVERTLV